VPEPIITMTPIAVLRLLAGQPMDCARAGARAIKRHRDRCHAPCLSDSLAYSWSLRQVATCRVAMRGPGIAAAL